jgi:hypothetical protein
MHPLAIAKAGARGRRVGVVAGLGGVDGDRTRGLVNAIIEASGLRRGSEGHHRGRPLLRFATEDDDR